MNPFNIIIAEDHVAFRQVVRRELQGGQDLKIIGEVDDGVQLLKLLPQVQPDLVILDISMPNMGGLETARIIKKQYDKVKVLFLTMHKNTAYVEQARLIGVEGYLLKEEIDRELLPAIDLIRKGKTYVSACFSQHLERCADVKMG
jgi:DNA-binding NarL/FixJ family response regulator